MHTVTMLRQDFAPSRRRHAVDLDELEAVREAERRLDDIYSGRSSTIPLIDIAKRYGVDC